MSKRLSRGDKEDINISPTVAKVIMGVGWDKNLSTPQDLVIDMVAYGLESDGYCRRKEDIIYYYNPIIQNQRDEIIKHHNPKEILHDKSLGSKDQEQVLLTLEEIPLRFKTILFCIGIYESHKNKYNLGMITNLHARIFNEETFEQIIEHEKYPIGYFHKESCLVVGQVSRVGKLWRYQNLSKGLIGDIGTINGIYLKRKEGM